MDLKCLCTCNDELRIDMVAYAERTGVEWVENQTSCRINRFKLMRNKIYHVNFKKYRFEKSSAGGGDGMHLEGGLGVKMGDRFGELVLDEWEVLKYSKTQRAHSLDVICAKLNETTVHID